MKTATQKLRALFKKSVYLVLSGGLTRTMREISSSNFMPTCSGLACFTGSFFFAGFGCFFGVEDFMMLDSNGNLIYVIFRTISILCFIALIPIIYLIYRTQKKSEEIRKDGAKKLQEIRAKYEAEMLRIDQEYFDSMKKVHEKSWYTNLFPPK